MEELNMMVSSLNLVLAELCDEISNSIQNNKLRRARKLVDMTTTITANICSAAQVQQSEFDPGKIADLGRSFAKVIAEVTADMPRPEKKCQCGDSCCDEPLAED